MDNRVYAVRCPDYEQAQEKMAELLGLMGGGEAFAAPGERLVLKANLLMPARPEQAVTPHPTVVAAVGRMAKETGASVVIADSPGSGYPYNEKAMDRVYRTCGIYQAAQEAGIEVNRDMTHEAVSFPQGTLLKHFDVITPVAWADGVLNVCKLKTHTYMGLTGAVKNTFGVIPGLAKPGYHARLRSPRRFAGMLLDLSAYVSPRLSVMDAVVGMEGDGPSGGAPRHVGWLLASRSPLALDVVAGSLIGLRRENNPVLVEAGRRGLHPTRIEQVEIIGADAADLRVPGYELPVTFGGGGSHNGHGWQRVFRPVLRHVWTLKPRVIKDKCIACGACRDACPVQAITIAGDGTRFARINDRDCIRCYCCHEMCTRDAIELRPGWLQRMAGV